MTGWAAVTTERDIRSVPMVGDFAVQVDADARTFVAALSARAD